MTAPALAQRLRIRTDQLHPRPSALRRCMSEAARTMGMAPNRFALHALVLGIAVVASVIAVLM